MRESAKNKPSSLDSTKQRALKILSRRAFSRAELKRRLMEKGESEENAQLTIEWLDELGFLNDVKYAADVVRHYAEKGYGRNRVKEELFRRFVPRELWDDALEEFPEVDDELDKLLTRRLRGKTHDRTELRKASEYLRRRGFGWDEIRSAIERFNETDRYTEEDDG